MFFKMWFICFLKNIIFRLFQNSRIFAIEGSFAMGRVKRRICVQNPQRMVSSPTVFSLSAFPLLTTAPAPGICGLSHFWKGLGRSRMRIRNEVPAINNFPLDLRQFMFYLQVQLQICQEPFEKAQIKRKLKQLWFYEKFCPWILVTIAVDVAPPNATFNSLCISQAVMDLHSRAPDENETISCILKLRPTF